MPTSRDVRHVTRSAARAAWRTRMFRVTLLIALLAAITRQPLLLLVPLVYYAARVLQALIDRLLDSVRARLAAFYLYVALLPTLLVVFVLLFVGYLVLGHVSAQVIERRLDALAHWAERRAGVAEALYWRARSEGLEPRAALDRALDGASTGLTAMVQWGVEGTSPRVVAARGDAATASPLVPEWVRERSFAGIALRGRHLELRAHRPLDDSVALGFALALDADILNQGLGFEPHRVRGGLGAAGRRLTAVVERADSVAVASGVLAWYEPHENAPGQTGSSRGPVSPGRQAVIDAVASGTRFPTLLWDYRGHPVDWATGGTHATGPQILIVFSVEGAVRSLLRTSFETVGVMGVVVGVACGIILVLQVVASIRGFLYARSISSSVAELDRGVRAVRRGDFHHRIQPRSSDQLGRLASAFDDMSEQLQTLLEERAAHQVVERELAIAREVQRRLFPVQVPVLPYVDVSGICLPARAVSGDYYDFIPLRDGYDFVVADVSGKGMSAALLMASVQAALRSQYAADGGAPADPGEILTRLNRHLHAHVEPTRFVTFVLVRFFADGRVVYCNAGHNPAVLLRGGRVEWLRAGGLVLGPFADQRYESNVVPAHPGDIVCLYTDGVTEALGARGEQYGEARLADLLLRHAALSPRQLQDAVVEAIRAWQADGEDPSDDITLVVLRVKAPTTPAA